MKLGWLSPPSRNENDGFPFFRARSTARIPHRPVSMFINTLAVQRIKLANRLTKYEIMVSCILERFGRSACSALSSEKTLNAKTDPEDGRTPSKPSAARRPLTIFENVRSFKDSLLSALWEVQPGSLKNSAFWKYDKLHRKSAFERSGRDSS